MALTQQELQSLLEVRNRAPHQLLGMHPLGDGSGLVARALVPNATKVELQPVHENDKPSFELARIGNTPLFEGGTNEASQVYAYDLVITNQAGDHQIIGINLTGFIRTAFEKRRISNARQLEAGLVVFVDRL